MAQCLRPSLIKGFSESGGRTVDPPTSHELGDAGIVLPVVSRLSRYPQNRLSATTTMNILTPPRPFTTFAFLVPSLARSSISYIPRRHESSARRTTKRLRVKPSASLTANIPPEQINDQIVFNPPFSAPSPYHTPPAVLPPNDPRRELLREAHNHANPYRDPETRMPPPISKKEEVPKRYHLTNKEIEEIRQLRAEDPDTWTQISLAKKYNCSEYFVGIVAPVSRVRMEAHHQRKGEIESRWGKRRAYAREDRQRRKDMWGRDE